MVPLPLLLAAPAASSPRYILMNMQYGHIPAFWPAFSAAAPGKPANNPALRVGVSTLMNLVNNDTNSGQPGVLGAVTSLLQQAEQTDVPVFLGIDGENWWANSGLANWWDPAAPGYDASNRHNVEWTAPDGATNDASVLKLSWRNWGDQIRVGPQQNLHSPRVMAAYRAALRTVSALAPRFVVVFAPLMVARRQVIPAIVRWYRGLPEERRYLLAGIKVGWEASIGWNACAPPPYPGPTLSHRGHPAQPPRHAALPTSAARRHRRHLFG